MQEVKRSRNKILVSGILNFIVYIKLLLIPEKPRDNVSRSKRGWHGTKLFDNIVAASVAFAS